MRESMHKLIRELNRVRRQLGGLLRPRSRAVPANAVVPIPDLDPVPPAHRRADAEPGFWERKSRKLARIRPLLVAGEHRIAAEGMFFDFLTENVRAEFDIVDTEHVSSHDYDPYALRIIDECADGLVLDCGAGLRGTYYDNVINFEICSYTTTDVRGVGERLPFRDGVFDAVFSFNVLEHVKDPFACARELARVLKPGGRIYCVVPFLQPFHAYPHHYYNMTHMGLRNLFSGMLEVESQEVGGGGRPIFTLTWILKHWLDGLPQVTRRQMEEMRVIDLAKNPLELWQLPFVTELSPEKNLELASTTSLFARKPAA